jgi:hypothetical protein
MGLAIGSQQGISTREHGNEDTREELESEEHEKRLKAEETTLGNHCHPVQTDGV